MRVMVPVGNEREMIPGCLRDMMNEGPGGGHHDNMMGGANEVACAFARAPNGAVWSVQNYR